MSSDQLKEMAGLCKCCKVCEGGVLIRQDEIADSIYVVISGGFRILKDFTNSRAELAAAEVVAFVGAGDVLGDIGFMTGAKRSAFAEAITSSEVLQITRNIMASMQVGSPQLKHHLALLAEEKAAVSANNPKAYHHEISLSPTLRSKGKREQKVERTTEKEDEEQDDGEGGGVSRSEGEVAGEDNAAGWLTGNLDALREYQTEIRRDRRQRWRCTVPLAHPAPITRAEEDRETVGMVARQKAKDLRLALARLIRLMHAECHEDAASWNLLQDTLAEHPECCNLMLGEYLVASSRMASSPSKPGSRAGKDAHSYRMTTPSTPKIQEKGGAVGSVVHNRGGMSLLHIASLMGLTKICSTLIERGADPNMASENGQTALHFVLKGDASHRALQSDGSLDNSRLQILRLLIACGAVQRRDEVGVAPLELVRHDMPRLILQQHLEEQLSACADPDCRNRMPSILCSRCTLVRYCCTDHAQRHWPIHKHICNSADTSPESHNPDPLQQYFNQAEARSEDEENAEKTRKKSERRGGKGNILQKKLQNAVHQRILTMHEVLNMRQKGLTFEKNFRQVRDALHLSAEPEHLWQFFFSSLVRRRSLDFLSLFDEERLLHSIWARWIRAVWINRAGLALRFCDIRNDMQQDAKTSQHREEVVGKQKSFNKVKMSVFQRNSLNEPGNGLSSFNLSFNKRSSLVLPRTSREGHAVGTREAHASREGHAVGRKILKQTTENSRQTALSTNTNTSKTQHMLSSKVAFQSHVVPPRTSQALEPEAPHEYNEIESEGSMTEKIECLNTVSHTRNTNTHTNEKEDLKLPSVQPPFVPVLRRAKLVTAVDQLKLQAFPIVVKLKAEEVYLEELPLDDLKLVCKYLLPDWKIAQRIPLLLDGLHPQEQIGPATSPHSRPRPSLKPSTPASGGRERPPATHRTASNETPQQTPQQPCNLDPTLPKTPRFKAFMSFMDNYKGAG